LQGETPLLTENNTIPGLLLHKRSAFWQVVDKLAAGGMYPIFIMKGTPSYWKS